MEFRGSIMGNYLKCRDGIELYYKKDKPAKPIGCILINHGFAEHCSRYDYVAEKFKEKDLVVYRYDLRGHGRTKSPKGHIDSFMDLISDADEMVDLIKRDYPELPIFMLGHSMGGFVTCAYGIKYPNKLAGQIFSGSAVQRLDQVKGFKGDLFKFISLFFPRKRIKNKLSRDLCRVPQVVEEYKADPLILKDATLKFYVEFLVKGTDWISENISSYQYPCLIIHGEKDKIVAKEVSMFLYNNISSKNKEIKIYDNLYHEILNENYKGKIIWDITSWIYKQLGLGINSYSF